MDSSASESKPTEPVSRYAMVFSEIVRTAAPMESHAYRVRNLRSFVFVVILLIFIVAESPLRVRDICHHLILFR